MTVRQARLNAGYTQVELAEILGFVLRKNNKGYFYSPAYSFMERGKITMSASMYLRLCDVLHVKPGELEPPMDRDLTRKNGLKKQRRNKEGSQCHV